MDRSGGRHRRWSNSGSVLSSHRHVQWTMATGEVVDSGHDYKVTCEDSWCETLGMNGVLALVCNPSLSSVHVGPAWLSSDATERHPCEVLNMAGKRSRESSSWTCCRARQGRQCVQQLREQQHEEHEGVVFSGYGWRFLLVG